MSVHKGHGGSDLKGWGDSKNKTLCVFAFWATAFCLWRQIRGTNTKTRGELGSRLLDVVSQDVLDTPHLEEVGCSIAGSTCSAGGQVIRPEHNRVEVSLQPRAVGVCDRQVNNARVTLTHLTTRAQIDRQTDTHTRAHLTEVTLRRISHQTTFR